MRIGVSIAVDVSVSEVSCQESRAAPVNNWLQAIRINREEQISESDNPETGLFGAL